MKSKKYTLFFLLLIAAIGFALRVNADIGEPGSETDPLVTKSYVDNLFSSLKRDLSIENDGTSKLEVVNLVQGQRLIGDMGTEIILRSGKASVIEGKGGGLADVTEGKDMKAGEMVPTNHLLLVPRADGRGILAQTSVVVVIRGKYAVAE
ncbi:MAG: hypothetical protein PWP45_1116 [Tepidanaerobacteraceae bacterium]|nr:hypothetical protein [Tepidanaerobacteraceae bacterium]